MRGAENVFEEIRTLYDNHGIRDFYIVDDIFNVSLKRALSIFEAECGCVHPDVANALSRPIATKGAIMLRSLIPESLLGKAQENAAEVQQQGQMVINVGQATGLLPEQLMPAAGPVGTGESAGSPGDSGYKDAERTDLNRLIQGSQ